MPRWQDCEQCLVNRSNSDIGQEYLTPVVRDPGCAHRCASIGIAFDSAGGIKNRFREFLIQHPFAVTKHKGRPFTLGEHAIVGLVQPLIHRVCCGHSWECEEQPACSALSHQAGRKQNCSFCFSAARDIFNNRQ